MEIQTNKILLTTSSSNIRGFFWGVRFSPLMLSITAWNNHFKLTCFESVQAWEGNHGVSRQLLKAGTILMFLVFISLCSILRFFHCFPYFLRTFLHLSVACCVNYITWKQERKKIIWCLSEECIVEFRLIPSLQPSNCI